MSETGRQLSHLLGQEMLALAQGDLTRLVDLLEAKRSLLSELTPANLDRDTAIAVWRENRQILEACRQVVPEMTVYGRPK